MRERVLVIEDEPPIRELILFHLERAGFQAQGLPGAAGVLQRVLDWRPEAIVVDLMLPDGSGLDLCRSIRERGSEVAWPGLIIVTALDEEGDRVLGLEMGADDYIVKPFAPRELVARVRAVLRRRQGGGRSAPAPEPVGGVLVDADRHRVTVGEVGVDSLTPTEFRILALLFEAGGRVLSRQQLLDGVWGADFFGDPRTVDVHIRHIRAKLGSAGADDVIETVRGFGYRLGAQGV